MTEYVRVGSFSDMRMCSGDVCSCTNSRQWMRRVYAATASVRAGVLFLSLGRLVLLPVTRHFA